MSGGDYKVASDKSIVETLRNAGISVPTSCEQGVCGTCLTAVLEGTPEHRDMFLTDEEREANDQMTPCVSRSHTAVIVLDL